MRTICFISLVNICALLIQCKKEPTKTVEYYLKHRDALKKDNEQCSKMSYQEVYASRMCRAVSEAHGRIARMNYTKRGKPAKRLKKLPKIGGTQTPKTHVN